MRHARGKTKPSGLLHPRRNGNGAGIVMSPARNDPWSVDAPASSLDPRGSICTIDYPAPGRRVQGGGDEPNGLAERFSGASWCLRPSVSSYAHEGTSPYRPSARAGRREFGVGWLMFLVQIRWRVITAQTPRSSIPGNGKGIEAPRYRTGAGASCVGGSKGPPGQTRLTWGSHWRSLELECPQRRGVGHDDQPPEASAIPRWRGPSLAGGSQYSQDRSSLLSQCPFVSHLEFVQSSAEK
jgi:hypothetical protein